MTPFFIRAGRAGYLLPGRQDDSLDLELGASASGSSGRKLSRNSSRKNSTRRFSGEGTLKLSKMCQVKEIFLKGLGFDPHFL